MNALKRINDALPGLVVGILGYGLVALGIGILLAPDKRQYAAGLAIGIACAVGMAIHLAVVLDDSVRMGQSVRLLAAKSVLRYVVVAAVLFGMMYFHIGSLVAAFIGLFGLKISAYIQQYLYARNSPEASDESGTQGR